ncbi:MAG: NAD-dependent epimerase/dehydratase family protein [Oscillospiraceae bacterium]|nr:NAD-dependent epimerase/dehydratase family protein [Oscillospiraceae bacterium]
MSKILVTGGTRFVSRYTAEYYAQKGYEVYVLNRNSRPQPEGVTLIEGDRHHLGERLKGHHFDAVLDITAYQGQDITDLLAGLDSFDTYIMVSSSTVYPETGVQPFAEDAPLGENKFWGGYGVGKLEAERELLRQVPEAYILRPPYLYGPGNNVYREAFVFDCAMAGRKFYLPGDGGMKLQFFYVKDLCRFMDVILAQKPEHRIFNVGNREAVTVRDWVGLCYAAAGKQAEFVPVYAGCEQRNYFSFYNYEYDLDVTEQYALMSEITPLSEGLRESYLWYTQHRDQVGKKPYFAYIDEHFS